MPVTEFEIQTAEHLASGEIDYFSRDEVQVDGGTDGAIAGTILGKRTADSVFVPLDLAATDGSEAVAGVLFEAVTGVDRRTVHTRRTELVKANLTYPTGASAAEIETVDDGLRALGLIPRT